MEQTDDRKKERKIGMDVRVLARFVAIYCRENHGTAPRERIGAKGLLGRHLGEGGPELCENCRRLLLHAASKRILCPYDPKPRCKHCPSPCHAGGYRERIREVMRFSGAHLIKRGRLDLLIKYFL